MSQTEHNIVASREHILNSQTVVEESPLLHTNTLAENSSPPAADPFKSSLEAGITWPCLASAVIICISPLQYGYHIAELNTPKNIITSCNKDAVHWSSLPLCLPMNDTMYSIATSAFAVGGLLGSLSAGWMAEKWGRRGALIYNSVPFIFGPLLMAFAISPVMLAVGRFISGLGSGVSVVIAPLYLSEIAPVKYRGTLNLLNQFSIVVGVLTTLTVGMLANSGPYWRISVGFGLVLACLHLFVFPFAVESPRYLWSRNKRVEARNVLRKLRHTPDVDEEVAGWPTSTLTISRDRALLNRHGPGEPRATASNTVLQNNVPQGNGAKPDDDDNDDDGDYNNNNTEGGLLATTAKVTVFNIFRFARYRKAWLLVLLLQFGQQLSGINAIFYYSSSVLAKMFSSQLVGILTMMIGVLNVIATASGALVVDRFGRRPLLFSSIAAMTVSMILLGLGLGIGNNILAAVSIYLVVASFAPGYGPVPFLLGTELFDVRAASAGGSWALAANWIGTFIVAVAFLPIQNLIGVWVFAIFISALLVCGAVFYFFIPETKGRTIEEIAAEFE
ncbi:Bifunctional purine biosynthesis protein PurH [Coemansia spiralis]|uniref:Bifunctional purine biosynthesis protein PurH n=2 Tax=Coemansia TaxID=4863 RepID=A0A9W8G7V6_9FUNG|nr:Bifunctional purine biosynthesis protein PurH [Coemansia umbellata]KAJ2625444.1 Bifunctional purine biosynthesis protein PurH [Coemansia sp. RSA 1358]KAJ2680567.1 Bifunctional purine biosynthesis protein PurH [Coemansia spiralis]